MDAQANRSQAQGQSDSLRLTSHAEDGSQSPVMPDHVLRRKDVQRTMSVAMTDLSATCSHALKKPGTSSSELQVSVAENGRLLTAWLLRSSIDSCLSAHGRRVWMLDGKEEVERKVAEIRAHREKLLTIPSYLGTMIVTTSKEVTK